MRSSVSAFSRISLVDPLAKLGAQQGLAGGDASLSAAQERDDGAFGHHQLENRAIGRRARPPSTSPIWVTMASMTSLPTQAAAAGSKPVARVKNVSSSVSCRLVDQTRATARLLKRSTPKLSPSLTEEAGHGGHAPAGACPNVPCVAEERSRCASIIPAHAATGNHPLCAQSHREICISAMPTAALLAHRAARETGGQLPASAWKIWTRGAARPASRQAILDDLAWLGLTWDGPVRRQSERLGQPIGLLWRPWHARGLIYPCFCTRGDIAREIAGLTAAPQGPDGPLYPGTCRQLTPRSARPGLPPATPTRCGSTSTVRS